MDDFRLRVFRGVATHLSFTKTADEMCITQPAVTKHVKELELFYKTCLFERRGNAIILTNTGEILLKYAHQILGLYQDVAYDIGASQELQKGSLKIGASTTIGQYLIAPLLAKFYVKFPDISLSLQNGNTEMIENMVLNHTVNVGIVEGRKHNSNLKYIEMIDDELAAVVHRSHHLAQNPFITLNEIPTIPLVLRERGSGTLEIIENEFNKHGIKTSDLKIIMHLGGTESIKSFLEHVNCMAFLPLRAVKKEVMNGELKLVEVNKFSIVRKFWLIHRQGHPSNIIDSFLRFAMKEYNKK